MSDKMAKELREWYVWHEEHKNDTRDVPKRLEFLEKMVEGLLALHITQAEDIQALEGRPPEAIGSTLYTPRGINVHGDVRQFG